MTALGDRACALCGVKRTTAPLPRDLWGCPCGTRHLLCYRCVQATGEAWPDPPSHPALEVCPVSDEYKLAREIMGRGA